MEYYIMFAFMILPLKRYADFKGRSRRKEYWLYVLFVLLASFVLGMVEKMLNAQIAGIFIPSALFNILIFVPSLAVGVRRLHDLNLSGWWILMGIVPSFGLFLPFITGGEIAAQMLKIVIALMLIGIFALLFLATVEGNEGANRFGEDPKAK